MIRKLPIGNELSTSEEKERERGREGWRGRKGKKKQEREEEGERDGGGKREIRIRSTLYCCSSPFVIKFFCVLSETRPSESYSPVSKWINKLRSVPEVLHSLLKGKRRERRGKWVSGPD